MGRNCPGCELSGAAWFGVVHQKNRPNFPTSWASRMAGGPCQPRIWAAISGSAETQEHYCAQNRDIMTHDQVRAQETLNIFTNSEIAFTILEGISLLSQMVWFSSNTTPALLDFSCTDFSAFFRATENSKRAICNLFSKSIGVSFSFSSFHFFPLPF
jgi:hypothetical protein